MKAPNALGERLPAPRNEQGMMTMENAQTDNSAACGQSRSTVGLEHMFRVTKTDHPDLVGGIVWTDGELAWINERITLAILAEREACAKIAEQHEEGPGGAETIRMRSND